MNTWSDVWRQRVRDTIKQYRNLVKELQDCRNTIVRPLLLKELEVTQDHLAQAWNMYRDVHHDTVRVHKAYVRQIAKNREVYDRRRKA